MREVQHRYRELRHRIMNDLAGLTLHQLAQRRATRQPDLCGSCIARFDGAIELYRLLDDEATGRGPRTVGVAPYLQALAQSLQRAFASDLQIETAIDPTAPLDSERAGVVGMILNEAITNAHKHAFPDGRSGKVRAEFQRTGDAFELRIADDGIGFDPEKARQGIGTQLMQNLARHLNGMIRYVRVPEGTELRLTFPI